MIFLAESFCGKTPCLVCISIAWSKQGYIVHYEDHSWCCLCIFLECLKKEDPSQWGKYLLFSYYLKDDHISMLLLDRKRIWRGSYQIWSPFEDKKGHDANLRQWNPSNSRKMIIEREFYIYYLPQIKIVWSKTYPVCLRASQYFCW